jgi:pSer/pThr/pTyr-binding forkhead associated (FHA) protein
MAFVTIRIKGVEGYTRTALSKDRVVVGRASESDLPIKHTSISREHCAFVREDDAWFIEDLGSSNGTWLGGKKLGESVELKEKDVVKIGKAHLTFHAGELSAASAAVEVSSDDELGLDDSDDAQPSDKDGKSVSVPEAMACRSCGAWMSTAHHVSGEKMPCPRCGHSNAVA